MPVMAVCGHTGLMELRCVIVDDDPRFIGAARVLLERDGMRVAGAAGSCAEAVERVAAVRPDVVLIDIRLGEQSGFEVARRLAGGGEGAILVMISTQAWADYADLVAASPAAGFVAKAELSADAIRRVLAPG
jgi:DNA-binding NarL/FixJ family response regulator